MKIIFKMKEIFIGLTHFGAEKVRFEIGGACVRAPKRH